MGRKHKNAAPRLTPKPVALKVTTRGVVAVKTRRKGADRSGTPS